MILFFAIQFLAFPSVAMPGENIELILLMREQVKELEKLVRSQELTAKQTKRAMDLSEQLTSGINATLFSFRDSREYAQAILELQKKEKGDSGLKLSQLKDRLRSESNSEILNEVKMEEQRAQDLDSFQQKIVGANSADLKKLDQWDERVQSAGLGEVAKMNAQMGGKLLESNLRVSMQITELLNEFRSLRREIVQQRISDNIVTLEGVQTLKQPILNAPTVGSR